MFGKEYILCSAIKRVKPREGRVYHKNDILLIEIGYRHHDILMRFKDQVSNDPEDQGFFTSAGRFVNRREAYMIAKNARQIKEEGGIELYSEDIY